MDVKEVENILDNIRWLKGVMPNALTNWKNTKPRCDFHSGIIKEICNYPGKLNSLVFDPLIKWLADYILNREGRIAFTGPSGLDTFLKLGLRRIYNFILIADFFSKNTDFFVPTPSIVSGNLQAQQEAFAKQKQYKDIINLMSSRLIGCNDQLAFLFLGLSKTIKSLPDDLLKMRSYLDSYCLSLRTQALK